MAELHEARIKRMMSDEQRNGIKYPYLCRDIQSLAILRKAIDKLDKLINKEAPLTAKNIDQIENLKNQIEDLIPKINHTQLRNELAQRLNGSSKQLLVRIEDEKLN